MAAILVLVGGCATPLSLEDKLGEVYESYHRTIDAAVKDPHRAEQLLRLGERVRAELSAEMEQLRALVDRVAALNRDYEASRADLESALADVQAQRRRILDLLLSARGSAVSLTTAAEWEAIAVRQKSLLSLARDEDGWL